MPALTVHPSLRAMRRAHHTESFNASALIARRALPIVFNTPAQTLRLQLVPVHPTSPKTPFQTLTLSPSKPQQNFRVESDTHGRLTLHLPPDAPIGLYTVTDLRPSTASTPLLVLFNPYHPADPAHHPDPRGLAQYLNNPSGEIYQGSDASPVALHWSYAQFRVHTLLVACHLLDTLPPPARASPILVSRHLSARVNVQDDDGVLVGRWDGNYDDGVSPTAWTGSLPILRQYWMSIKPVQYAQCWVFAAVLNSLLRALGLASVPVTNFSSAHESVRPYNRVIEHFFDAAGRKLPRRSGGSLWNFHVWNQVWMRRPDLDETATRLQISCNGWQAVDATPQEPSLGLYRLGPAPVNAVKHGVNVDYDADFVISETNADVVHLRDVDNDGKFVAVQSFPRLVGRKLLAHMASGPWEDVTLLYKFPEGSPEERKAFYNRPATYARMEDADLVRHPWRLEVPDSVTVGHDVTVQVTGSRAAQVHVCVVACDYSGAVWHEVVRFEEAMRHGEESLRVVVSGGDYWAFLKSGVSSLQIDASARGVGMMEASSGHWSQSRTVRLSTDGLLEVETGELSLEVGQRDVVRVTVRNRTAWNWTECIVRVEGDKGLVDATAQPLQTVGSSESKQVRVQVLPRMAGEHSVVASLQAAELGDVHASARVIVRAAAAVAAGTRAHRGRTEADGEDEIEALCYGPASDNVAGLCGLQEEGEDDGTDTSGGCCSIS